MYRNVLVPLDGTEFTEHEVEHALHVIAQNGKLNLLHVMHSSPLARFPSESLTSAKVLNELDYEKESQLHYLRALRERVHHRRRDLNVTLLLNQGQLENAIVKAVEDLNADLVVLAQSHRSLFERILRSSTTESLLQKLEVPALVVHGPPSTRVYQAWSTEAVASEPAFT